MKYIFLPLLIFLVLVSDAQNVGVGTTSPGTKLDVTGAITLRETQVAVSSNAATIPSNVTQVQLTGTATATITITPPTPPNAGQLLTVYNNTTGGYSATLGSVTIPDGQAIDFIYSNSAWIAKSGAPYTPTNIYTSDGTLTGNRTMTMGNDNLTLNSTTGNLTYNTSTGGNVNLGGGNTTTGNYNTALGFANTASGSYSTAMGTNSTASGKLSTVDGYGLTAPSYAEIAVGASNTTYTPASTTTWNTADRLFGIGNGVNPGSPSDALVVLKSGKVGIGTALPQFSLHVYTPGAATSMVLGGNSSSGGYTALVLATSANTGGYSSLQSVSSAGGSYGILSLNPSGSNVGVGTVSPLTNLDVSGNLLVRGATSFTPATPVSAVEFAIGRQQNGTMQTGQTTADIALEYASGGFRHFIMSRHLSGAGSNQNAIDFYLNNSNTSGGSSAPGTGNVNSMSITATGVGIFTNAPASALSVGASNQFQVNSSGAVTAATGITSGGTVTFSGLNTAGIVTNTAAGVLGTIAAVPIANGGTGSTTQNWVDLTTTQTAAGAKTWSNNATFNGGTTTLSNGTSNTISYAAVGVAAPTYTTSSAGSKIILYPQVSGSTVDYALGIASSTLWYSVPGNTSTYLHSWYGGTSELMRLTGTGYVGLNTTNTSLARFTITSGTSGGTAYNEIAMLGGFNSGEEHYLNFTDAVGNIASIWGGWNGTNGYVDIGNLYANSTHVTAKPAITIIGTNTSGVNGLVGIGTTSPAVKLHVIAASNSDGILIQNTAGGSGAQANLYFETYAGESLAGASVSAIDDGSYSAHLTFGTRVPGSSSNSLTERMRVTSAGYVGIGTTSPAARLTVIGDGSGTAYIGGNFCGGNYTGISFNGLIGGCGDYNMLSSPSDQNLYINRPSGSSIRFRENNGDEMTIASGGYVGINTTTPGYPLDVESSGGTFSGNFTFYARGCSSNYGCATNTGASTSIYASGRMVAAEFDSYSDRRIKKDIQTQSPEASLDQADRLKVVTYRYIDQQAKGDKAKTGFIAQEVEQVMPNAVNINEGFLPSIFEVPVSVRVSTGTLSIKTSRAHGLAAGDIVRIMDNTNAAKDMTVSAVTADNAFTIDGWKGNSDSIFVYGKKVSDFRNVDFDQISAVAIGSIQELNKKLKTEQDKNRKLEEKMASLEKKNESTQSDVDKLKASVEALQQITGAKAEK